MLNQAKKIKWIPIVYGVLLTLIGVLTLIYAITNPAVVDTVISISIAVALFIVGIVHISFALVAHTSDFFNREMVLGSIAIAFGVVLCVDLGLIGQFIVYLLGAFFLAFALVSIVKFVLFIVYRQSVAWIVIYIIMALVCIAIGVLVLCFRNESKQILYCFVGASIILSGLFEIILGIKILMKKEVLVVEKVEGEVQEDEQEEPGLVPVDEEESSEEEDK